MNCKQVCSEISVWFKQVFHFKNCWILLPGLIAVLLVYAAHHLNVCTFILSKPFHEHLALWLVASVFLVLVIKSLLSRDPLMIYLAALALVFFVREFHDTTVNLFGEAYLVETKKPVNFLFAGMGLWGIGWRERLFSGLNRFRLLQVAIFGMLWGYFFSQVIARRVFKGILPDENLLHVPFEETAETGAHLFFLLFAVCCFIFLPNKKQADILGEDLSGGS